MRLGTVRLAQVGAVLAVIAVAAIAWFAVLSPRLSTASLLREQATALETANLSLRSQYNQALAQAEAAPAAAAEAQVLFARMPRTADLPTLIEQITAAATSAGIPVNAVTTLTTGIPVPVTAAAGASQTQSGAADAPAPAGVKLATMDIGVTAEGTREQVLAFLDNLQELDRSLLVTSTIDSAVDDPEAGSGGPERESMQVGGQMFVLDSKLPDLVATVEELIAQAEAG